MTWGSADYERFKRQELRDRAMDYEADRVAAAQRTEEIAMSRQKTAQGDRVERFPDLSDRGERIAEVRRVLAEAFEKAEAAVALEARMADVGTNSAARFPVLGRSQS